MDAPDSDANVPSYSYGEVIVAPVVMLSLSAIGIFLRCWVKKVMLRCFTLDDWFLLLSFALFATLCILAVCAAGYGFGVHENVVAQDNLVVIYRLWFAEEIAYLMAAIFLKLSISILLLRLLLDRGYRIIVWGTAIVHTTLGSLYIIGVIVQCRPVWYFWTDNDHLTHHCAKPSIVAAIAYTNATTSLVTDLIFAVVPTIMIWSLSLERRIKISMSIVLSLGFIASCVNIIRYNYIDNLASPGDNSFDFFVIGVVSIIEIGLGIVATCLASCRPLMRLFFRAIPCLQYTQPSRMIDEEVLGGLTHATHSQQRGSTGMNDETLVATIVTARSQAQLEDDIRAWEDICARSRRRSALDDVSADYDKPWPTELPISEYLSKKLELDEK